MIVLMKFFGRVGAAPPGYALQSFWEAQKGFAFLSLTQTAASP
jgi:hypothetical protein